MPDRYRVTDDGHWLYVWTCVTCGSKHAQTSTAPPAGWAEDADASYAEPGTFPRRAVRDAERWEHAGELSDAEKALIRHGWAMVDELRGRTTIHEVGMVWDIERALVRQDVPQVVAGAVEYVNLLDWEAIHGQEWDSYHGDTGDVTAIRADLALIPLAAEIRAGRDSPCRPASFRLPGHGAPLEV